MQSHNGEIHILPALPKAWSSGEIKGIVARGGFEVSISWDKGKLTQVSILSKLGNECKLHYGDKIVIFETEKGSEYKFNGLLEN